MKKLTVMFVLALFLCILFSTQTLADHTVKFSYDFNGSYHIDDNAKSNAQDVKPGFSVGYEYTVTNGAYEYGIGLEYQFTREIEGNTGAQFYSIPLYGTITRYFGDNQVKPYLTGRLGYNFMDGNTQFKGSSVSGGYYFGFGGGVRYTNYIVELLYSGSHCQPSLSNEMEYNKCALTFGYKF